MSKQTAEAVVTIARGTNITPSLLSELILKANDSGTTAAELEAAARGK